MNLTMKVFFIGTYLYTSFIILTWSEAFFSGPIGIPTWAWGLIILGYAQAMFLNPFSLWEVAEICEDTDKEATQ